ncbi:hypothetical protein KY312_03390 [Candidatus Woesearchaeota archaeon]|nr:hypothetical protein [Candidatus Woesearchaeota archaeon]
MDITIYHTRDVDKISRFISFTMFKGNSCEIMEKYLGDTKIPLSDILQSTVQDEGLHIRFQALCPSIGQEAIKKRNKTAFFYRTEREAYMHESLDSGHYNGEHLGVVVADVFAVYDGSKIIDDRDALNVTYGHLDFMLVGFDEKKPAYGLLRDFFNLRLEIKPDKVPRDKLEDYKKGIPYSGALWDAAHF